MGIPPFDYGQLERLQNLVIDILRIERNHRIPQTERRENVVEHSFSVAMLCWKVFELTHPPLDIRKIFKYSLAHDFAERGMRYDVNSYASKEERLAKKEREVKELEKISNEMDDFDDLVTVLKNYEGLEDEEALFVWTVDKMQAILLGKIDDWRPYKLYHVSYDQYCAKNEEILSKCSPYLKTLCTEVYEYGRRTYYDQPLRNI